MAAVSHIYLFAVLVPATVPGEVTWRNFYFRLFAGGIRSPQIILFLSHLLRHIPGKSLIVWDGLPGHRSRAVWDFVREQRGRLWLEFLPAYAPELNPGEYLWAHWKNTSCPTSVRRTSDSSALTLAALYAACAVGDTSLRLLGTGGTLSIVSIYANLSKS